MRAPTLAAFAATASATLTELQCSDTGCSTCRPAQTWEEGKCYGVGNAPPYKSSQKATVSGSVATLASYSGDSCAGSPTQTDAHPLDACAYFTGQIWTKFTTGAAPRSNATKAGAHAGGGCPAPCPGSAAQCDLPSIIPAGCQCKGPLGVAFPPCAAGYSCVYVEPKDSLGGHCTQSGTPWPEATCVWSCCSNDGQGHCEV